MAATNIQSGDDGLISPSSQRGVTSPWNRIVRGGAGESEGVSPGLVTTVVSAPAVQAPAPASPPSSSVFEHVNNASSDWSLPKVLPEMVSSPDDYGTEGQGDASKKPAWNRPSNGVVDAFSPVMGAAWPALGESTKPTLKSSSSESLKTLSDGSLSPALQVTGSSSPSNKQATAINMNSTSTPNHVAPSKQRSFKRGGGNSSSDVPSNGVVYQPPTSQDSVVEPPHNVNLSGKPGNDYREPQKGGFLSQSHSGNDYHHNHHNHQRGSYKRGNGRSFNNRDHDRGTQEWNQHSRSFNNRDTHVQSQRGFSRGGYMRPAVHTSASLIPPPMHVPMQPFGNNMLYPDVTSSLVYFGPPPPMPFGAPISPVYFGHDPLLNANIVSQIDYYFSNENLVRDTYLRRNMDEQGWVSASLIAGFKKVSSLTDNIQLILDVMRSSTVVEVQGDKIRRRNDWMKWIMPAPGQYLNPSSPHEGLVTQVQSLALHGSSSEGSAGLTGQQAGFDHPSTA